jgi:anti-sigma regulatory factor (Ser/Thr protein kinase)/HAMP domain-containing protein
VILTRLFVREKLNLLVVIPLVVVLVTTVPFVADRLTVARSSADLAAKTRAATEVARLVQELQRERALALAFLAAPRAPDRGPLVRQAQAVSDVAADVGAALAVRSGREVRAVLPAVRDLSSTRKRVLHRQADGAEVYEAFRSVIARLTNALRRYSTAYGASKGADHVAAFRALAAANEEADGVGAALMVAVAGPGRTGRADVVGLIAAARALEQVHVEEFRQLAPPTQIRLFDLVREGAAASTIRGLEPLARPGAELPKSVAARSRLVTQLLGAVQAQSTARLLVQDKVARDLEAELTRTARQAQIAAALIGALALGTVTFVVALSVVVGRSIAHPLRRLSVSAGQVADLARAELVRVSDEDMVDLAPPQLAAIDIRASDEIGELAAAFNRVQATAALLLERQVVTRRNFATMFANIGRRTQNLVGRQLALIDQLERDERNPALLESLYRLDHLSTRLQRSANSLVVLSGRPEEGTLSQPMPLANAVRAALGEIEGFQQVQLIDIDRALLTPSSALDIVLLLAELLENATSFSPPNVPIEVTALVRDGNCRILIVDHGIGMSEEQMAEENRRLIERERLDLAPTDVLGLFVVGRLARRHRLGVQLLATSGGGVTAEVVIPGSHLIGLGATERGQAELVLDGPVRRHRPACEAGETLVAETSGDAFGWWQTAGQDGPDEPPAPIDAMPPANARGLRRRVRGARLPDTGPRELPPVAPVIAGAGAAGAGDGAGAVGAHDAADAADAARAMVEEFTAAVQLASADASAAAPPGTAGLRRRVRGAQLPSTGTVLANARGQAGGSDADASRAMVDEFESGVARARGSLGDREERQE